MWVKVKVTQLYATLCDSMDYRVHGILQAIILDWVAILFSRGSSQLRDQSQVSRIAGWFFTSWAMICCEFCFKKSKGRGRGWNYLDSFNVYATKLSWQLSKPNDTSIWQNLMLSVLYVLNSLHRQQPTRLPRPWDSPGKNAGVGCNFLLQCMKVKSESEVAQSCPTLSNPMDCSLPGSSIHGIFQERVLEWGAIAFSEGPVK